VAVRRDRRVGVSVRRPARALHRGLLGGGVLGRALGRTGPDRVAARGATRDRAGRTAHGTARLAPPSAAPDTTVAVADDDRRRQRGQCRVDRPARPPARERGARERADPAARRRAHVGRERAAVRALVLAARRRRPGGEADLRAVGTGLPLRAAERCGPVRRRLAPNVPRLPLRVLHERSRVQPHRHDAAQPLGEDADASRVPA
jgi:hypothetical protein